MENTFATCDKYINYYINFSLLFYGIFRVLTYHTWEYEDALQNLIIQPSLCFFFLGNSIVTTPIKQEDPNQLNYNHL